MPEETMNSVQRAEKNFKDGFSCSQAVFAAFAEDLGLERETALRISTGFGAGMARMTETCGAVTGAIMVIGLKHGRVDPEDLDAKEKTYSLVGEFVKRFRERHGSIVCRELLGCDIGTEEGMEKAASEGLFEDFCPSLVKQAAEILGEII
jgi:C_GCAxxG_C_C family probable redox protein